MTTRRALTAMSIAAMMAMADPAAAQIMDAEFNAQ